MNSNRHNLYSTVTEIEKQHETLISLSATVQVEDNQATFMVNLGRTLPICLLNRQPAKRTSLFDYVPFAKHCHGDIACCRL